jgi:hypothetical protein
MGGGGFYTFRPRWWIYATTPIRWLDLPALMEGAREVTVYASTAPILDAETDDLQTAFDRGFSRWFYIPEADMKPENIFGAFRRSDRVLAEVELTEKVLMSRAARAANRGRWPDSIAGFGSTRIRDGEWIYERHGKGIRIRFSRELHWPKGPLDVPLAYASN